MRAYKLLSPAEKKKALLVVLREVVDGVCNRTLVFNDEAPQALVDAAIAQAHESETPWFAAELVYKAAKVEIDALVRAFVAEALYADPGERVIYLGDTSATVRQDGAEYEDPTSANRRLLGRPPVGTA